MNRAERRRQAKTAGRGKFIVTSAFLSYDDLVEVLDESPAIAATLDCMLAAMGTGQPPLCGACGAGLTIGAPPVGYVLLRHSGSREELLTGVCFGCLAGDRAGLQRRLATALGVEPLPVEQLHLGQWGRA